MKEKHETRSNTTKTLDELEQELVKQAVENIEAKIGAKKTSDPYFMERIPIGSPPIPKLVLVC